MPVARDSGVLRRGRRAGFQVRELRYLPASAGISDRSAGRRRGSESAAATRRAPRPLGIGRKVDVPEYGEGEIRGVDGDKVLVAFADGQTRKFKRDYF